MDDIDLSLLTPDEQGEYARLGDIKRYSTREQFAANRVMMTGIAAWLVIGSVYLIAQGSRGSDPRNTVLFLVTSALVLLGFAVIVVLGTPNGKRAVLARQAAYLVQIGYASRSERTRRAAPGDGHRIKSTRQQQHEWYGENSDLDWQDRKTAEMYGMDADTYKSNFQGD